MATDATGTPTSLGIPTFLVGTDAPTGNGSNAQMASIDTLIKARVLDPSTQNDGEPLVWDAATSSWKPVHIKVNSTTTYLRGDGTWTSVAPAAITGYPADGTKALKGDGTWGVLSGTGTNNPKVTVQALSSGPPASPSDGDIWIATGVGTNGERWQFQYNASAPTYKWVFIGGSPITITSSAAIAAAGWVSIINFTATRAGIYSFDGGIQGNFAAAGVALQVGWGDNGVVQGGTGAGTTAGSGGTSLAGIPTPATVAAGHNITLMANVGSSPTAPASSMRIVPVVVA